MEVGDNMEDFIIQENRHRELVSVIKGLFDKMPKTEVDLSILGNVKDSIDNFLANQSEPKINKIEDDKLSNSIQLLNKELVKNINELKLILSQKTEPKEWEFTVKRHFGSDKIEKITAKIK